MQFKKDARGLSKNTKNKESLPIPVIPISDTDEEDVPLINSMNIKLLQEQPTIQTTTGKDEATPPSDKDKDDSVIPIHDRDQEKEEDFEMFEESDSFWEDGQRLIDSWYGIKKVPGESVPDDDNDDICVQGLLNVENSNLNYVEGIVSTKDDDDDDESMTHDKEFDNEFDKIVENYEY